MKISRLGNVVFCGLFLLAAPAYAGGPLFFNETNGAPFRWFELNAQSQVISRAVFFVETGDLGKVSNQVAANAARKAFATWAETATADLQVEEILDVAPDRVGLFKKDITGADFAPVSCDALAPFGRSPFPFDNFECELIRQCAQINNGRNCPSPVIFDSDGSIFDTLGVAASVIGFSGALLVQVPPPGALPQDVRIAQARVFLNGRFFDGDPSTPDLDGNPATRETVIDDATGDRFLPGLLTHETGHFLGLAHSVVNGNQAAFNRSVETVGTNTRGQLGSSNSVDALASVPLEQVETMFPFLLVNQADQQNFFDSPQRDDTVALSTLYPCTAVGQAAARVAGRKGCTQEFASSTGSISGRVFIPNASGGGLKRAQGVVVVARRVDDQQPDNVLATAVSQLTGATFAPRRCLANLDLNGDGKADIFGLFGACATPAFPSTECSTRFPNAVGPTQCGFFSFVLSAPRPIPSDQENLYVLQGLPPGEYIVQAIQTIIGGFSSPVRSIFNPILSIRSDDDVLLAFFPNPQTGEFYNGLPNGCGGSSLACGNETGDSTDNPFAFTRIKVTAGGPPIENVNIFLNTGDTQGDVFSDPGFDYCGLGDVNTDGKVDQADIFAVVTARAAFDKDGTLNKRADLNDDGTITLLDVDIITDLVTVPNLSFGSSDSRTRRSELVRSLAPFEAICTAGRDGGCQIQAPVETIQDDRMPAKAVCDTAKRIGCQVSGCQ